MLEGFEGLLYCNTKILYIARPFKGLIGNVEAKYLEDISMNLAELRTDG